MNQSYRYILIFQFFLTFLFSCSNKNVQDKLLPLPNAENLNPEKRIAYLTKLIGEEELSALYYERARIYLDIKRFPASLRDINRAIALDKETPEYYVVKGKADFKAGNIEEALNAAQFALDKGMNSLELNLLLGELYYENKDEVSALRYLQKVLVAKPNNYDAILLSGQIYANQNDTAASFQYLRKAIGLKPNEKKPYNIYLALLSDYELYDVALKVTEKYLINNQPDASFSYYLGELIEQKENLDSAMYWYEKSFTETADWKPGIKIARYRMRQGDLREASRLYEQVLIQNPAIENGYYELGYLNEYLLGSLEKALNAYQNGLKYDTLNNRYPYYINRINRKIEFQNL